MRRRKFGQLLAGTGSLLAAPAIVRAQGQNGVALVIGNSKYKWEASLPNVKRDAPDVARRYEAMGLKTEILMDADRATMAAALERMKQAAQGARLATIYFAGHGVATDKGEALVPVDADLSDPSSIKSLMPRRFFLGAASGAVNKLMVFDNCRNNPSDGWRQLEAERRAVVNAGSGGESKGFDGRGSNWMMIHSTAPGLVALDGPAGQNSPFALAFLKQLAQPSQDIHAMIAQMRRDLLLATGGRQILFSKGNAGSFALAPGVAPGAPVSMAMASPARVIELPRAYAFAREQQYVLPSGLVSLRPEGAGQSVMGGSFRFMNNAGKYGAHPAVVVVIGIGSEGMGTVLYSGVGFTGDRVWRSFNAPASANSLKLYSATAGTSEYLLEWGRDGKATVTAKGDSNIKVVPLERLDG